MFRIKQIYENDLTSIVKIQGEIALEDVPDWRAEITPFMQPSAKQLLLEISAVDYICPEAVQVLIKLLTRDMFLMDGPVAVRNMVQAAGLASHVLD